jgi:hypothetical protein
MDKSSRTREIFRFGDHTYTVGQPVSGQVAKIGADVLAAQLSGDIRDLIRREGLPPKCRQLASRGTEVKAVTAKGGYGLGLFIAKGLVESMRNGSDGGQPHSSGRFS